MLNKAKGAPAAPAAPAAPVASAAPAASAPHTPPAPPVYAGEAMTVEVAKEFALPSQFQWEVTGNFRDFFDILGFPGAPNTSEGDGVSPGSSITTMGFGEPMMYKLLKYDAALRTMSYEMTAIPSLLPMSSQVVTWTVSDVPDGCTVSVSSEIFYSGPTGKGKGMPGDGAPPFATYDGMVDFWQKAYAGWMEASGAMAKVSSDEAAALKELEEIEDMPLLPPEPEVAAGAPPEECGGTTMSAKLAAAVRQAGAYLKGIDKAVEDRFNAKLTLKDTKAAAEAAKEKQGSAWKSLTKVQEKEREAQKAYEKAVEDEPLAEAAAQAAREAKAEAEKILELAETAEGKEKVKARKAEKKKETDEAKKKLADASKEEKLAEKAVEDSAKAVEEKQDALDKVQLDVEKATEKHALDTGIADKRHAEWQAAIKQQEMLDEEDRQKGITAKKLKAAIERDANIPDE